MLFLRQGKAVQRLWGRGCKLNKIQDTASVKTNPTWSGEMSSGSILFNLFAIILEKYFISEFNKEIGRGARGHQ